MTYTTSTSTSTSTTSRTFTYSSSYPTPTLTLSSSSSTSRSISTSISPSSITPTRTSSSSVSVSVSVCPACFHEGNFYGLGEEWTDNAECIDYKCVQVENPCAPNNISAQVEINTPVCQECPAGYVAQNNSGGCCPDCVPTKEVPDVCSVDDLGKQYLEHDTADKGKCVSLKKHKATGCSGVCGSSVTATLGSATFLPTCRCCQPKEVRKYNVTMKCDKVEDLVQATYHEILSCSCEPTRCDSTFNMDSVNVQEDDRMARRSLLRSIETMPDMDDDTARRQRRSLLNDLALVHAKKKRK